MKAAEDLFGGFDILVNNAGMSIAKRPEDLTGDDWRQVLDANLTSVFLASKAAYPALKARGGGKIINIGSMYSIFGAWYSGAYSASKGGVAQLTKSLAIAWAADNIQVNVILPGWIATDMTGCGARATGRVRRGDRRPDAGRSLGRTGRSRRPSGVSRQRRVRLRHRRGSGRRRRLVDPGLTAAG